MGRDSLRPFVVGLLVVQAAISVSLWVLNPLTVDATTAVALLLSADVLVFGGICHIYFSEDQEAAEAEIFGRAAAPVEVPTDNSPVRPQPLIDMPTVISRRVRLTVPVFSTAILLILGGLVASGRGTTSLFIPIFLAMVVVYVLASIYLFKILMEREKRSTDEEQPSASHASH